MAEKHRTVRAAIFVLVASSGGPAYAAECLSAPKAQSAPGTHWQYRTDRATGQRCWFVKELAGASASESRATSSEPPRGAASELAFSAPPAERESSISTWFSSKLVDFANRGRTGATREADESIPSCASASNLDPWRNRCNSLHSNNLQEKRGVTVGSRSNALKVSNSATASTIWLSIGVGSKLDADSQSAFRGKADSLCSMRVS